MQRNIVFLGNCQAEMVAGAAAQVFAEDRDIRVSYHPNYSLSEKKKQNLTEAVRGAQTVFLQRAQFDIEWISELISSGTKVHYFPALRVTFLWPDAGKVVGAEGAEDGVSATPLSGMRGSEFLTKLATELDIPREIIGEYLRTNIAEERRAERQMKLDRLMMQHLARDTDIDLWKSFEEALPKGRPYFSPWHPDWSLLEPVARYVIDAIGNAPAERREAIMNRYADENYFSQLAMPVHPSVAQMFDLKWSTPEYYMYNAKYGFASMADFARLYVLVVQKKPLSSYQVFQEARAQKQNQRAVQAARRVLNRRIGIPSSIHVGLAELLADMKQTDEALAVGREILEHYKFDLKAKLRVSALAGRLNDVPLFEASLAEAGPSDTTNTLILRRRLLLAKAKNNQSEAKALAKRILARDCLDETALTTLGRPVDDATKLARSHWKISRVVSRD